MGNSIARIFAQHDFRIVLISRTKSSLDKYVSELAADGYEIYGEAADASDIDALTVALLLVSERFGAIDVLIYNAAYMSGGKLSEISPNEVLDHYKTDVLGAHTAVSVVLPGMKVRGEGAILFTGGLFGVFPNANPDFACMSMDKSALRVMAQMLNVELKNTGIFCGIVNIMGSVGENEKFNPANIAEKYWQMYQNKSNFEYNYE